MAVQAPLTVLQLGEKVQGILPHLETRAFSSVWKTVAQMAVSDVQKNFNESHGPDGRPWLPLAHARPISKGADKPLLDTGLLARSITGRADPAGVTIGTNLEYAALHQFGGRVVPVRAKFLAIPLTKEAKRAGSPRRFPGNPRWRFVPTRTGGWVMMAAVLTRAQQRRVAASEARAALAVLEGKRPRARRRLKAETPIAQYVLVSEVNVPARPFLGFSDYLIGKIDRLLTDVTAGAFAKQLGGNP